MPELTWSTDPVAFYRHLHPRPVLLTACAKLKGERREIEQLGSITDPAAIAPTGVLADERYQAVWWTVCGQRPLDGLSLGRLAAWPNWHALTRKNSQTDADRVDTLAACWVDFDL